MADTTPPTSTYAVFWLYRAQPTWRHLPHDEQQRAKGEFVSVLEQRDPSVTVRGVYSLVGFRGDADLLIWVHGPDLDAIQRLAVDLNHTGLGRHLSSAYNYVGMVAQARYDPEHRPSFLRGLAPLNFISMYPFVKTSDWYLLPYERRRELMADHGRLGRRYTVPRGATPDQNAPEPDGAGAQHALAAAAVATEPHTGGSILTNTVDAFGLGDYEFVVAFESNDASELCRMVEELRTVEVRRYTKVDVPIFLGRRREPADALADL
jgi:hydrogen peroxide-dependent heme synthase